MTNNKNYPGRNMLLVLLGLVIGCPTGIIFADAPDADSQLWKTAELRGAIYEDCGRNAQRLLRGWLENKQDPQTHLYPKGGMWNYHNEAADHYASLVLIANYVRPELNQPGGALYQTLLSCKELCLTENGLLAEYDLKAMKKGPTASLDRLSEWLRDGFIRLMEAMGTENIWYEEFVRLSDAMLDEADRQGGIEVAFTKPEFVGHMLQSLSRLYLITGNERYLLAAEKLADAQLADPDKVVGMATLWDHSCEMTPGLGEFIAMEGQLHRPRLKEYAAALRVILDRLREKHGHPETGFLCENSVGQNNLIEWKRPPNAWGYVLFTYQNYDQATGEGRYENFVKKPLKWMLDNYKRRDEVISLWPYNRSSDAHSDTYESILTLMTRYPDLEGMYELLDWTTLQHIHRRQSQEKYGPYTGGHFDGSTGRTLCIHMMLHSQGVRTAPFVEGLRLGGVQKDGKLYLSLSNCRSEAWKGLLRFDWPRNEGKAGIINWSRINEYPQWFTVRPEKSYQVAIDDQPARKMTGKELMQGLAIDVHPEQTKHIWVAPVL